MSASGSVYCFYVLSAVGSVLTRSPSPPAAAGQPTSAMTECGDLRWCASVSLLQCVSACILLCPSSGPPFLQSTTSCCSAGVSPAPAHHGVGNAVAQAGLDEATSQPVGNGNQPAAQHITQRSTPHETAAGLVVEWAPHALCSEETRMKTCCVMNAQTSNQTSTAQRPTAGHKCRVSLQGLHSNPT